MLLPGHVAQEVAACISTFYSFYRHDSTPHKRGQSPFKCCINEMPGFYARDSPFSVSWGGGGFDICSCSWGATWLPHRLVYVCSPRHGSTVCAQRGETVPVFVKPVMVKYKTNSRRKQGNKSKTSTEHRARPWIQHEARTRPQKPKMMQKTLNIAQRKTQTPKIPDKSKDPEHTTAQDSDPEILDEARPLM